MDPLGTIHWDPFRSERNSGAVTTSSLNRIKRDLMALYADPVPGVVVIPESTDITLFHALITGPFETPYECGFFYFVIRFPNDYPIRPPRVKLMTTGNKTVRFNPNLYKDGKVCLSILGTWTGPGWTPAQTLSSLLLSIQSLMNVAPYHNEPGFEKRAKSHSSEAEQYNAVINHETLRVAVCGMLEDQNDDTRNCPKELKDIMRKSFLEYYENYEEKVKKNQTVTGQMTDPFREKRGSFDYPGILKRLQALKVSLCNETKNENADSDCEILETPGPSNK